MCICVHLQAHGCHSAAEEVREQSQCPPSPSTLFETGSCGVRQRCIRPWLLSCLRLPPHCRTTEASSFMWVLRIRTRVLMLALYPPNRFPRLSVQRALRDYTGQTRSSSQTLRVIEAGRGVCLYPEGWWTRKPLRNGIFLQGHCSFSSSKEMIHSLSLSGSCFLVIMHQVMERKHILSLSLLPAF